MSGQPFSHIVLRPQLQELERLNRWLGELIEFHRLPPRVASQVDLCLTEIVTNVISHAYPQTTAPTDAVMVRFARERAQVIIQIEDGGIPFDPVAHVLPQLPTSLDDAQIGGSGLRLVRQFTQRLDYRRDGEVNRLTMVFASDT